VLDVLWDVGARRLILIPAGPLAAFPLHAMYEERDGRRRCLVDDFEAISYAPSVDVLARTADTSQLPGVLAVQDPDRSLRYAATEVALLRGRFPSMRVLAHEQATKPELMRLLPTTGVVHLACHSRFLSSSPYDSGLTLSDGVLSLAEIYMTAQLHGCRLVTLSGCESVRLDEQYGDEFLSLASGFSYAGAASVVGSLWDAEDLSTMLLMHRFYGGGAGERAFGVALADAQAWLRDACAEELAMLLGTTPFDTMPAVSGARRRLQSIEPAARPFGHPAYWAPFTYFGV
jgi:CHAT domain-containing protein